MQLFSKKPKRIIRHGTLWVLAALILLMIAFASITPVTLLYDIGIESKENEVVTVKIESVQAKDIISGHYRFFLVKDINSFSNKDNQIKCEIISVENLNGLLVIQAQMDKKNIEGNRTISDDFKFLRIEGVSFLKLVLSKLDLAGFVRY